MDNGQQLMPGLAAQEQELRDLVATILDEARAQGADAAEVGASVDAGLSVTARLGEVETVEFNRDRGFGITVYRGQRKGSASTSDSRPDAVRETVRAACDLARFTTEDRFAGLADPELMATHLPDLALCHPWEIDAPAAIEIAIECEAAAREMDARISNSEGATVNSHTGVRLYGNSHGFIGGYPWSRHSLSCSVIAGAGDDMQRDYWYTTARRAEELESAGAVGRRAAERTLRRLGSTKPPTGKFPVLYAAEVASGLIGHLFSGIAGGALYRKSSFLLDQLGQPIFPEFMRVREDPLLIGGSRSAAFDDDGVATSAKDFVTDGVLQSYLLSTYSGRRMDMPTTGNAGGARNVFVDSTGQDFDQLLEMLGTGLVITELMGFGVNVVTGDYSRGCAGFWVENGRITGPVEEATVAANLSAMFRGIRAVGTDVDHRGNTHCGSILIDEMTVAGA